MSDRPNTKMFRSIESIWNSYSEGEKIEVINEIAKELFEGPQKTHNDKLFFIAKKTAAYGDPSITNKVMLRLSDLVRNNVNNKGES